MMQIRIRDPESLWPWIRDKHSGSATLQKSLSSVAADLFGRTLSWVSWGHGAAWPAACRPPYSGDSSQTSPTPWRSASVRIRKSSSCTIFTWSPLWPVLRIHEILVWIRIQILIRGSMPQDNGSGFGSGSCYFRHWPSSFSAYYELFEGTFTSFFKDKKSKRSSHLVFS